MVDTIIKNVGGDGNIASEQTLKQLVLALGKYTGDSTKTINNMKGLLSDRVKSIDEAANHLQKSFKDTAKVVGSNTLRSIPGTLKKSIDRPVESMGDAISGVSAGFGKLLSFTPYVGGMLNLLVGGGGGLIGSFIGLMQNNVDAFRDMSQYGGGFAGDLIEMRKVAAQANMSLGEFTRFVKENSGMLASLGGNVSNGADMFTKLSKNVQNFDNRRLAGLGFSFDEINDTLASYIDVTKLGTTAEGRQSIATGKVTKDVVAYGQELTLLSNITGKSRKQIAEEVKANLNRGNVLAYMDSLTENQKKSFVSINTALGAFSPTLQTAMADLSSFGGYLSEESQVIGKFAPNLDNAIHNMQQKVAAGLEMTSEDYKSMAQQAFLARISLVNQALLTVFCSQFTTILQKTFAKTTILSIKISQLQAVLLRSKQTINAILSIEPCQNILRNSKANSRKRLKLR